ncbi:PTS sugar transporter subunit IIC [Amphibacillus sp. Q70]|uniref:PTS sugar transporter subunit IIC n=1 Tax=Amphibacillus sp. Q70 TaxID=3453416 RepID=UPI003F8735A9
MKTFMNWLTNSFAPTVNKFTQKPWVAALSTTMRKIIPFILTGSLIFLYNVVRSYIDALPDLGRIADFTFGMLGVITAFILANQAMEELGRINYTVNAGLTAVAVFLLFTSPIINDNGMMTVEFARLGPMGILAGIIAGYLVAIIFNLVGKMNLLSESSLPDFVIGWIHNIIPIFVSIGIAALLSFRFNLDIFDLILDAFSPIQTFGQTLPGFILIIFMMSFFYSIGMSSWVTNGVITPIFMAGIVANIELVSQGLDPVNIVTRETVFTAGLITMGGIGATLTLNLLMLFSKSKDLKTIGKLTIIPSIFNINEPIVYSAPVVLNPLLMVPMWINAITGPTVVYLAMRSNLLNIPAQMIQVGQIPDPFASVMITEDFRAVFFFILLFGIYLVTWYPFFKVYEKQKLQEEAEQTTEGLVG